MQGCGRVRASYRTVSVEDALYLAVSVNADINTTIRGTAARLLLFILLIDVDDALYLAVTVTAYINATFSRGTAEQILFIFLLLTWVLTFMPLLVWVRTVILLLV